VSRWVVWPGVIKQSIRKLLSVAGFLVRAARNNRQRRPAAGTRQALGCLLAALQHARAACTLHGHVQRLDINGILERAS
jgi:hypothetical protein